MCSPWVWKEGLGGFYQRVEGLTSACLRPF